MDRSSLVLIQSVNGINEYLECAFMMGRQVVVDGRNWFVAEAKFRATNPQLRDYYGFELTDNDK
ncbi:hypothetical protein A6U97_08015 [Agrobacterium tumefaciens]|nr:hypothetical protein A6U97_08015 [Agrobacterium tumefaciens]